MAGLLCRERHMRVLQTVRGIPCRRCCHRSLRGRDFTKICAHTFIRRRGLDHLWVDIIMTAKSHPVTDQHLPEEENSSYVVEPLAQPKQNVDGLGYEIIHEASFPGIRQGAFDGKHFPLLSAPPARLVLACRLF